MSRRPISLLALGVLVSCAQVREPTGGPVDTDPPHLVEAQPPYGTTRFTGDRILLTFNERIKLERVGERLIVSPPLEARPDVRVVGGRTVELRLNAPLRPGATHVFNIGDAVVDLTEGNPAGGLTYVVSTGDHLDSLEIAGQVVEARTGRPADGVAVLAYGTGDTTGFRKGGPEQFTRSDASGRFSMKHLAPGRYELHALRDQNGNLRYDLPNEEVAFLNDPVEAMAPGDSTAARPVLRLFREPASEQALLEAEVLDQGAFRLVFALPAGPVTLVDMARRGGDLSWTSWAGSTGDTVLAWPSDTTLLEEGRYAVQVNGTTLDTLRYGRTGTMPWALEIKIRERPGRPGEFLLRSTRPILRIDTSRVTCIRPEGPVDLSFENDPDDPQVLLLRTDLREGQRAMLELFPKAITGIYGGTNDTVRAPIGLLAREELGHLHVELEGAPPEESGPWLMEVLDAQGNIVHLLPVTGIPGSAIWERVPPGTYRLRLLHDRNGNGRWDPGVLEAGVAPERVEPLPDQVQVRANWEVSLTWKVTHDFDP